MQAGNLKKMPAASAAGWLESDRAGDLQGDRAGANCPNAGLGVLHGRSGRDSDRGGHGQEQTGRRVVGVVGCKPGIAVVGHGDIAQDRVEAVRDGDAGCGIGIRAAVVFDRERIGERAAVADADRLKGLDDAELCRCRRRGVSTAVTASVRLPPVTVTVFSIVPTAEGSAKALTRVV